MADAGDVNSRMTLETTTERLLDEQPVSKKPVPKKRAFAKGRRTTKRARAEARGAAGRQMRAPKVLPPTMGAAPLPTNEKSEPDGTEPKRPLPLPAEASPTSKTTAKADAPKPALLPPLPRKTLSPRAKRAPVRRHWSGYSEDHWNAMLFEAMLRPPRGQA
jgi:hypothetical protein